MKRRKILFVAAHRPGRSPSQRFRFEQYLDHLAENGFEPMMSYLISESDDRAFYAPGHYATKAGILVKSAARRAADAIRATRCDIVFVQREAFMTGTTLFEWAFARSGARLVFDFDDAIWLPNVSSHNRMLGWLKDAGKTSRIIGMSDMVFAGNPHLAEYASAYNDRVRLVPTTIDTDEYRVRPGQGGPGVCIGWSGSPTTIQHFEHAVPALRELKRRFGERLRFKVIGDASYRNVELGVTGTPWRRETEVDDLVDIDIGIMPLPDDPWAKGKCGLKGLQYMALGIPTVMSPVGVNSEIVAHGENGYLASTTEQWVEVLSGLVEDAAARERVGMAGRRTVEERFSVASQRDVYLECFHEVLESHPRTAVALEGARPSLGRV